MTRARKPKQLEIGVPYRMWDAFCAQPSEQIAVVTKIVQATRTTRQVYVEWLKEGPGWKLDNYRHFLGRVHSIEPRAMQ